MDKCTYTIAFTMPNVNSYIRLFAQANTIDRGGGSQPYMYIRRPIRRLGSESLSTTVHIRNSRNRKVVKGKCIPRQNSLALRVVDKITE